MALPTRPTASWAKCLAPRQLDPDGLWVEPVRTRCLLCRAGRSPPVPMRAAAGPPQLDQGAPEAEPVFLPSGARCLLSQSHSIGLLVARQRRIREHFGVEGVQPGHALPTTGLAPA